jgi:hypothetical protein
MPRIIQMKVVSALLSVTSSYAKWMLIIAYPSKYQEQRRESME